MSLSAGTRLGPYEILAPLGAGGMGEVYRARDPRLGREVAIKVLPAHLSADPERRARFEREARAASSLNHPHICTLHDIGQHEGTNYLVMEYVDGQTLAERLRKGALAADEALERGIEIAQALEHAHRSGIIHRDLKPANVMVQADGRTKILDFGLAKLREGGAEAQGSEVSRLETRDAELTGEGSLVGTAAYMSPEQAKGSRLDARADLFSLGVLLYEMATGRNPFQAPTAVETLGAILKDRPPAASEVNAKVPVELSRLIDKLLAKEPSDRPASAGVVLEGLATSRRSLERGPRGHSIAVLPFANMSTDPEQEYFCEGMAEELINALTKVESLRVAARTSAFQFKGRAEDVKRIGEELRVATVLEGSVRKSGNRLRVTAQLVDATDGYHLWSERYDRQIEDVFALQDEITGSIIEALKPRLGIGQPAPRVRRHTENIEAYHLYLKGRHFWFGRYEAGLQKALACFEQAIAQDPAYALAHAGVADAYAVLTLYGFLAPEAARSRILAAAEKAIALDDALPEAHVALGASRLGDWDWAGAERAYDRALELDPSHVLAHGWRGTLLAFVGRSEEAIAGVRRAQELDPLSPFAHAIVGHCLRFVRRHDEAVEACRAALEFDPSFLFGHYVLGLALCHRSEHEEGIAILERAAALSSRAAWYVSLLGWAYASAGKRSQAEEVLRELEQRSLREYIAPLFLAFIFAGLGETDRAFECLERAYATQVPWLIGLKVEPIWDTLRPDPRFHDLLRRLRLVS